MKFPLRARCAAEFLGSAFLVAAVVGSGIMAERLAGGNAGLALLANTLATGAALVALILALVYWLREGMRDYDHVEQTAVNLPAVISDGPPPGVHMPGPSFRPILGGH